MLYESYSTVTFVIQHSLDKKTQQVSYSMCCMSNKALGVGSRGTIQHLASPLSCCMGLLTPPSVHTALLSML